MTHFPIYGEIFFNKETVTYKYSALTLPDLQAFISLHEMLEFT